MKEREREKVGEKVSNTDKNVRLIQRQNSKVRKCEKAKRKREREIKFRERGRKGGKVL